MTDNTAAPTPEASKKPEAVDLSKAGWGVEKYELKHPFVHTGATWTEIEIRVPSGRDLQAYYESDGRTIRALTERLVNADARVLDAMHGADYARLTGKVGEFAAGVR